MKVQFGEYTCNVLFGTYSHHDNVSIQLVDERDGQLVATATLNPEMKLEEGMVCIKNYSENHGMLQVLRDAGIVSPPVTFYQTGFVTVPVCKLMVPVHKEELVRGEGIFKVQWVAHTDEFTTYEFITNFDVYVQEADMDADEFRLTVYNDGSVAIYTTFSEDYDVGDVVTGLFDVDSIRAVCEASNPDDMTDEYIKYYAEQEVI